MINVIKKILIRVKDITSFTKKCIKDGGVTNVNISQIYYGEILKAKNVLITGGGSGIGLAIAEKAISEGANVVISGRNLDKLRKVRQDLGPKRVHVVEWDISDIALLSDKLNEVESLLGASLDIVVNNAGILPEQNIHSITESDWDRIYSINSKGMYFLSQEISNRWINKQCKGKIINISSTSAFYGSVLPYGMSKWDIRGMTEGLGKLLWPKGIIVNSIAPGRIATQMLDKKKNENLYDPKTSAGRYGIPEEIAELALFLMSDAANFIVGQTIVCDGSYTSRM